MTTAFIKQQEILDASIDKKLWALFCEAGTGKTFMAIKTAEHWWNKEQANCVLVICPKTLIFGTWISVELPKHSSISFNSWGWKSSFTKTMKSDLIAKIKDKTKLLYVIVNHDALCSKNFLPVYNTLMKFRKTGFVYDESTAIKSQSTDRAKAAIAMGKAAVFKRIMTGTPITEGPLDVFAQTEFLEEGILGFKSYFSMKTRYCEIRMKKFGARSFPEIIGYRDLDNLYSRLEKFSSFLKLRDCVDMPEQVFSSIAVEMTPEQETHYKTLRKMAIAWIEEHEVTAVNALALMRKLHQVAVGQMKIDDTTYVSIPNNRLETLKGIMDESNHQVIIWSVYRNSTLDILKYLGDPSRGYFSETLPGTAVRPNRPLEEGELSRYSTEPGLGSSRVNFNRGTYVGVLQQRLQSREETPSSSQTVEIRSDSKDTSDRPIRTGNCRGWDSELIDSKGRNRQYRDR